MPQHHGNGRRLPSVGDRKLEARDRITAAVCGWRTDRILSLAFLVGHYGREVAAVRERFATLLDLSGDLIVSRPTAMRRLNEAAFRLPLRKAESWLCYVAEQGRAVQRA